jgi:hypothetical protein
MDRKSNLVGPASYIRERIAAFKEAGVTVLAPIRSGRPVKTIGSCAPIVDDVLRRGALRRRLARSDNRYALPTRRTAAGSLLRTPRHASRQSTASLAAPTVTVFLAASLLWWR